MRIFEGKNKLNSSCSKLEKVLEKLIILLSENRKTFEIVGRNLP